MKEVIYLVIGLVIGLVLGRRSGKAPASSSRGVNDQQLEEKKKNLYKILASFGAGEEITNDKVEQLLGVSDSTAERYLDELESQGALVQVGRTGSGVVYKKV